MDIHSLFITVKSSGLNVNFDPLETVFSSIAGALKRHDEILSKFPEVEAAQRDLRKDLNRLRLATEFTQRVNYGIDPRFDSTNELLLGSNESCHLLGKYNACADDSDTYGIGKCDLANIQQKQANDIYSSDATAVSSILREIKSVLRRLQKDRDAGVVNSIELDERIKSTKDLLFEVQQKLASTATMEQLHTLKVSLVAQYSQIEHRIQDYTDTFHAEVDRRINQNLSEIKSWFNGLEDAVKQHQGKLEQRVASCATEYDVASFRDIIESDLASLTRKTSFLDDTARAQGRKIVVLQQKNAIAMLHQTYSNRTQTALKASISRWIQFGKRQIQYEQGKKSQVRHVRKILTNMISRRKRNGFGRWVRYLDWHRKIEQRKLDATSRFCVILGSFFLAPMSKAFNQWRRRTLLDMTEFSGSLHDVYANGESYPADAIPRRPIHNLLKIVGLLNGDVQGALYALAQEVTSTKYYNIPTLRQQWCAENQKMMATIHSNMNVAIQNVNEAADKFRETINDRIDSGANDLTALHSKIDELFNTFDSSRLFLERTDTRCTAQIDAILAQEQTTAQILLTVQERVQNSAFQITSLREQQAKSNESLQYLHDAIANNEKRHDAERESCQQALDHFGDELLKTKVALGHTRVRCEFLEKELNEAKLELFHFQDACQAESDIVQSHIHHPGIEKPSMRRIVCVGHAYETIAKNKTYVPGINISVTLRSTSTVKMKRNEEKVKKVEDVEIPSEIAAFAHDYAAWIAYHADHESMLRLIAGTNPDNQVYAEDDTISRRKELCIELKSELGTLLERASATVVESSNKHDSSSTNNSTRGMGLRWEARVIFLARIMDAVNAALSKHDQVLLPASTRIGKVGTLSSANVNVCMACDRPMRNKTLRSHSSSKSAPNAEGK